MRGRRTCAAAGLALALSLACGGHVTVGAPTYCGGHPDVPLGDPWTWLPVGYDVHVCVSDPTVLSLDYDDPGGDPVLAGNVYHRYVDWMKIKDWQVVTEGDTQAALRKGDVELDVDVTRDPAAGVATLRIEQKAAPAR